MIAMAVSFKTTQKHKKLFDYEGQDKVEAINEEDAKPLV